MTEEQIKNIISEQKRLFATGKTLPISFRKEALRRLKNTIIKYEDEISEALFKDLNKCKSESYMCEIGLVKSEITYMLNHVRKFSKEKRVHTPLAQSVSRSFTKPVPYGCVLIMSPWNYPFLLTMEPLVDALAAGNTAVVKPSAYSPETSKIIEKILSEAFDKNYVCTVTGGRAENQSLLHSKFDYVFFTGGTTVGKEVMRHAAEHLTPITLELGGKSPCIVDKTANISLAAKRIVFGKFINCGQTCVAPDYIYCDKSIKDKLIEEIKKQIILQYGENPLQNESYGKIINEKHFNRICSLITAYKIVIGGKSDSLKIEPTVMDNVEWSDPVMQEEIFGPVLPVLTYNSVQEAANKINSMPSPLALYIFSSDKAAIKFITGNVQFGGGCINDTLIHLATSELGFGGVGESGMGSYHGKCGFDTFSHTKSIVDKKTFLDLPMRYRPYTKFYDRLIRFFVR